MPSEDRLKPEIIMFSPENQLEFVAKWSGSNNPTDRSVAEFKFPGVAGVKTQDLGAGGNRFPGMTIYFDDVDHDYTAKAFQQVATDERGLWTVIHPVQGEKNLQLLNFERLDQPVEAASYTAFRLNWVESINIPPTGKLDLATLQFLTDQSNGDMVPQFNPVQTSFAPIQALKDSIAAVQAGFDQIFGPILQTVGEIQNQVNQIQKGITSALDAAVLNPLAIAGQIQELTQLPVLINQDFQSRFQRYEELANGIFDNAPETTGDAGRNEILNQELTLSSLMVSVANVSASSEFTTRDEAINAIEKMTAFMANATNYLDNQQKLYQDKDIDEQYFSQSQAFGSILALRSASLRYLLSTLFDLSIERKITLKQDRCPVEIVATESGTFGDKDINLDLFIARNGLKNEEIRLLRAGTTVVLNV
jgi:hypothetical protein